MMGSTRRWIGVGLVVLITLAGALAGCGDESPDPAARLPGDGAAPAPVTFRVAGNAPLGTPWHDQWTRFEAAIRAAEGAGLAPQMFVTGQLGNPDKALADTRRGRIQVGGYPLAGAATVVPELNVLLIPYLFESEAEVDFVLDNYLLDAFETLFEEKQLVLLQWVCSGWNNLYGQTGFERPEALAGRALRSQPTVASQLFLEALGADTVPMGFAEVLPSLQTGLIDGGESVTPMYLAGGLVGEAPHLTLTRHAYDSGVIVANRAWYEGLTTEQQAVVAGAIGEPTLVRREVRGMVDAMIARAEAEGALTLHELDPEARAAWQEATAAQADLLLERIGGRAAEILAAIERGREAYRARAGG